MPLLQPEDVQFLTESFAQLTQPVTITVVTKEKSRLVLPGAPIHDEDGPPDASEEVRQIVDELAATSTQLRVERVDAAADPERARELVGDRLPAMVFSSATTRGKLRYYGLPAGYEMSTLVAAILDVGMAEPMLPPEIVERMTALEKDVHLQVFVTPT